MGLARIGFSVCVTVRLGGARFKVPQAFFAAIAAVLAYLLLACLAAVAIHGSGTKVPVTALDCGSACCRIVTACDLHLRLDPLTSRQLTWQSDHSPFSSLYSVLQVSPSTSGADLRGAARDAARRVRDGGFSDTQVDSMVTAVYRTAQFLEHDPSRQAYDEFFMRALTDDPALRHSATNRHQPRDTGAVPDRLTAICSAARDQCCDTAVGSP